MSSQNHRLPPHLVPLIAPEWALWKWFVLRGAGFPAHVINCLSDDPGATAADNLLSCEMALQSFFDRAIRALDRRLDGLKQCGLNSQDASFKAALNARHYAAAGKLSPRHAREAGMNELCDELETALATLKKRREEFEEAFRQSLDRQGRTLREVASNPQLQEAVLWQNRHAYETAVRPFALLPEDSPRNQRHKEREQLVANYLQRYCLKNDTIGFFGPAAWGTVAVTNPALEAMPGPALIKERRTYFEDWAIDQLAVSLSSIPGMEWWSPPRLAPHFHLEAGMLHAPGSEPLQLDPLAQAVLPLCDGKTLPSAILAALQRKTPPIEVSRNELLSSLKTMADQKILLWRLLVPVEANSEINLRHQLLRIQDPELRQNALEKLDRLEEARRGVSEAAGEPLRLHSALHHLETTFEEITQTPGQRNAGITYGGRTLVYEDCRRDLNLKAAPELLRPVVSSLSLLLRSLRWLMQSMSLSFLRIFREVHRELAAQNNSKDVSALEWWSATEPRLINDPAVDEAMQLFLQKWKEIIPLPPGVRQVQWDSCKLRELVEQAFPDLPGEYHPVRYYCPDLLVTGTNAEAIGRGEAMYVLGEMHSGKNSLIHTALVEQHPDRSELVRATQWDLSPGCFKIAESRAEGKATTRTSEAVLRPADYFLSTTADAVTPSGFTAHPFSNLLVTESGGRLMATTRDGSRSFEMLEAFSDLLFSFVVHKAVWLPRVRHLPRVALDQLVIQRETWRIPVEELEFAAEKEEALRFLGARRWAKKFGMPETMFVRVPVEVKPFYLDLSSPVYVEILCKMVRRLQAASVTEKEITFSEMLPRPAGAWLPDASGMRYTSEFRFAIVDLKVRELSEQADKGRNELAALSNP